jgi:general secretion pathway protein D
MVTCQKLAMLILLATLTLPALGDTAKEAYKRAVQAERQANYDAAYENYKQAHTLAPTNPKYLAEYMRTRFNAAAQHTHNGQLLRNSGALTEAMAEFQRAAAIDDSSFIAQQEVRQTAEMIRRKERQQTTKPKVEPPPSNLANNPGKSVELQPLSNAAITYI